MKLAFVSAALLWTSLSLAVDGVRDNETLQRIAQGSDIVVLDVYAEWCGACQKLHPKVVQLDQEFAKDKTTLRVLQADADNSDEKWINKDLKIKLLPTVIQFKKDKDGIYKEVRRKIGDMSFKSLKAFALK